MDMKPAIDKVYTNRNEFLIIGLTGRIGSGCTTAANILCSDPNDLEPVIPDGQDCAKREFDIVFDYFKCNWKPLQRIRFADVITTFLLETEQDRLIAELKSLDSNEKASKALDPKRWEKRAYNVLHQDALDMAKTLSEDGFKCIDDERAQKVVEYFDQVGKFTDKLRMHMNKVDPKLYVKAYQTFGDNVRKYGAACRDMEQDASSTHLYSLAERAKWIIKCFRKTGKHRFVIDAFRNPFEAMYFAERYNAFYLIAIKCDSKDREDRLINKCNLPIEEVRAQDDKESPRKTYISLDTMVSQNIPECLQKSDIHINNCGAHDKADRSNLVAQLARYVSLILHPGLVTPTDDERFMQIAYAVRANSGCISRQVGAVVLSKSGKICGVGWNDVPCGQVSCLVRSISKAHDFSDKVAYSEYEQNDQKFREHLHRYYMDNVPDLGGRNLSYCFKDVYNSMNDKGNQVHTRALHAEENAFLQISKHGGIGVEGGTLYVTATPCELCAKKSYQLGIKRIVYIDPYPGISLIHVLGSGSNQPKTEQFYGAIGKAYHKLYDPLLSYKDELEAFVGLQAPRSSREEIEAKVKQLEEENARLRANNSKLIVKRSSPKRTKKHAIKVNKAFERN